jgi:phosphodiesterase/alkaline phosphatase D-like protein
LTLILAGVFIINENTWREEAFEWPNKIKLFDLIAKHERSNVMFLSGDVHYGRPFFSACEALTGY